MFQPRVKLEFVRRYLPQKGWHVCVDIDPSEEGRTASGKVLNLRNGKKQCWQTRPEWWPRSKRWTSVSVIASRWCQARELPYLEGDPDVVAYDPLQKRCVIAEVEGASAGQPEQKLYKAIGQMVRTVSNLPPSWTSHLVIVVYGDQIADHLQRARALAKLGVSGLALGDNAREDRWLFGEPLRVR
jgi:hypothetical protein